MIEGRGLLNKLLCQNKIPRLFVDNQLVIASCQLPDGQDDIERSLGLIIEYTKKAQDHGAEIVCFPECFLQGYVVDHRARERAIDLSSELFIGILAQLAHVDPILVIGFIELRGDNLYNSAFVVKNGEVLGNYRKTNLIGQEKDTFEPGHDVPIFKVGGMMFGINICYDLNFPDCAAAVADQGAKLLVCPCNNMLSRKNAEKWKHKHNEIRSKRSIETGLWLLSSDVTGKTESRISYGPTALINRDGVVVSQVPLLESGLLVQEIDVGV